MPPFKDEHILIIAPGSQTTLAQLGLPESYTPARLRVHSRMFPAEKNGEWEPIKVREKKAKRKHAPAPSSTADGHGNTDDNKDGEGNGESKSAEDQQQQEEQQQRPREEVQYEEDPRSDEGAVFPLVQGRIENWSCFFALLTHVYNTLSPPFHTPILMIAQPAWTVQDQECITQFVFEKFRSPAFALMDAALATIYAYNTPTATVVDVGYGKADVTAVADFTITGMGRGIALPDCGGNHMTERLETLLADKGFTREMTEQLKRSNICEVLAPGIPLPSGKEDGGAPANPAAVASTGVNGTEPSKTAPAPNGLPRGPGQGTEVGGDEPPEDDEGVLDVASLVTSGKTNEFLARKEKEKAERAAAKRGGDAPLLPKATRLQNAQRPRNTFHFEEQVPIDEDEDQMDVDDASATPQPDPAIVSADPAAAAPAPPPASDPVPEPAPAAETATTTSESKVEPPADAIPAEAPPVDASTGDAPNADAPPAAPPAAEAAPADGAPADPPANPPAADGVAPTAPAEATGEGVDGAPAAEASETAVAAPPAVVIEPPPAEPPAPKRERVKVRETSRTVRTEMEVGLERFKAADDGMLDQIADAVHRVILSVPEIQKRSELWDAVVILGNGSRVRGFKDALIATLSAKYLISPSSATIFTSELPSNMSTPAGTGANTPQPQHAPAHHASGVNPLLIAATTASNPALAPPPGGAQTPQSGGPSSTTGGNAQSGTAAHHSGHGQTPTSIRLAKMADYFPEWKEHGFEEAHFLGAQVAAKILFILDQSSSKGFMSRSEYNELGPQGIHEYAMC